MFPPVLGMDQMELEQMENLELLGLMLILTKTVVQLLQQLVQMGQTELLLQVLMVKEFQFLPSVGP